MSGRPSPLSLHLSPCLLLSILTLSTARVLHHPECEDLGETGRFYCPDDCDIVYRDGCPYNCNCGEAGEVQCPAVSCPAPPPICIVITRLDKCQSCACKLPFQVLDEKVLAREPGFIFFSTYQPIPQEKPKTHRSGRRCRGSFRRRVEKCLGPMREVSENGTRALASLNPIVRFDTDSWPVACQAYRTFLKCLPSNAFQRCGEDEEMSGFSATFGAVCQRETEWSLHSQCIQQAHNSSFRLSLCEDHTTRALAYLGRWEERKIKKEASKCSALKWAIDCQEPWIRASCTNQAAHLFSVQPSSCSVFHRSSSNDVHDQDIMRAAGNVVSHRCFKAYTPPQNHLQDQRCNTTLRSEIDEGFRSLSAEYEKTWKTASYILPLAFSFSRRQIQRQCSEYDAGMSKLSLEAKNGCMGRHQDYDRVLSGLLYPCGPVKDYFLRSYHCLFSLRWSRKAFARCEFLANSRLEDGSAHLCETFDVFAACAHPIVRERCGRDGWEVWYQYLSHSARRYDPKCMLFRRYHHGGSQSQQPTTI